jgi:hypothetical protein
MPVDTPVRDKVLTAISDDYEDMQNILRYLDRLYAMSSVTPDEVCEALADLTACGLAQAYLLSPRPPHARKVDFDSSRIDQLWFYVTAEGKKLVENMNRSA